MNNDTTLSIRYKVSDEDPYRGGKSVTGPKWVQVSLEAGAIVAELIKRFEDWEDTREGKEIERGELVEASSHYYLNQSDLLPKRGSYVLVGHDNTNFVLAISSIQDLLEGTLSIEQSKRIIQILLPVICFKSPAFRKIMAYIKPIWMDGVLKALKKPKRRKAK